jgi:hypothetical protein
MASSAVTVMELLLQGVDPNDLDFRSYVKWLRWFRYGVTATAARLIAVEEWLNHKSKTDHKRRIAVFDTLTGQEIIGPRVDALTLVSEVAVIGTFV